MRCFQARLSFGFWQYLSICKFSSKASFRDVGMAPISGENLFGVKNGNVCQDDVLKWRDLVSGLENGNSCQSGVFKWGDFVLRLENGNAAQAA